ncbi:PEP-CTERM sorting domain-containing protein [Denitromonas iodatirespirans]|uniref:PEP-CTERM sorting domain-containing protein n=1 Tax=Denitromonas iodatirespirans TaxID=2795389 RepID=A0A944DCE1_DENI1|nr:PEP-CTERM sorting domain-containing protein [Denitromonas iodatirespirans]MBT0961802.1 PEP-CTERM sorting domain-containing protein [Denitromonas iodatirespirans]
MAQRLLARVLLACIGLGAPAAASALPMYAYSKNEISDVIVQTGTEAGGFISIAPFLGTGFQQAVHGGDGLDSQGVSADPQQAKSGPGPFPGENDFDPSGERGAYARADTCVFSDKCQDTASNVAEVFRPSAGEDRASAEVEMRWDLKLNAGDDVRISFWAWPDMHVKTSGDREHAAALYDVFLSISPLGNFDKTLFSWSPCGDADDSDCRERDASVSVFGITDPFDLHQFIECVGHCDRRAPGEGVAPSRFEISVRGLGGIEGQEVILFLESTEAVRVWIPEPGSLALLGAALLAGWASRGAKAGRAPLT